MLATVKIQKLSESIYQDNDPLKLEGIFFFDEDGAFWKSKGSHLDFDDEMQVAPKNVESKPKDPKPMEQYPLEESDELHESIDSPRVIVPETRKKLGLA